MKSNVDDQCGELFKELKFGKKHRFLIFKVDNEKVVTFASSRSSKKEEKGNKNGVPSSNLFLPKNQECASSTWSIPIPTE